MPMSYSPRAAVLRGLIEDFLTGRLNDKLKTSSRDDDVSAEAVAKRNALRHKFEFTVWIDDAAHRAAQIHAATHVLKAVHPGATGTNLWIEPKKLPRHGLVGSYCLGQDIESDVVGNAAALDVYKFLKLAVDGQTLLDLMRADDADLRTVLSDDEDQAREWFTMFTSITRSEATQSSHTLAKQLYWLTGDDAHADEGYHLLAPLFASSLTHRVHQAIDADRFGETSKNARQARRDNQFSNHVLHDYPNMAVQKVGGTKPQNISQLNSERRGNNYLLASLPPRWKTTGLKPLLNIDSMFQRFDRRPDVKLAVRSLLTLLRSDPAANLATRTRRDGLVRDLAAELSMFGAELRTLPVGWSQSSECRLSAAEKQWLDPDGVESAAAHGGHTSSGGTEDISEGFGRWLNRKLRDPLPMGDPEYLHWCALAQAELDAEERDTNHAV
jgi:CRISPR-associated protein Csy1